VALLDLKRKKKPLRKLRKKRKPKFKNPLPLFCTVLVGVYYTHPNTLYRETRLDPFIVLQIFKLFSSRALSQSPPPLYLCLFIYTLINLTTIYPSALPSFYKKGYCIPQQSCSLDTQTPHFDATYKKNIYKFFYYYNNYYYPLIKKNSYFSSCYVERKMLLSSVAISSPIPYTIKKKKITKNAKKTL